MERINDARKKITEEALELNNNFATFIEEYLNEICTTVEVANKLCSKNKSLKEFCKKAEDDAREMARRKGAGVQCAGRSDAEYYKMAEDYYEITDEDKHKVLSTIIDIDDLL